MESDSFVIRNLSKTGNYLLKTFRNSLVYIILKAIADWFRWLFGSCLLLEIMKREGTFARVWKYSKTYDTFARILIRPTELFREKYDKRQQVFTSSHVYKLIILAADNLHVLVSFGLFLTLIIPHSFWYNIFTTMMVIGLVILFFVKTIVNKDTYFRYKYIDFYLALFTISILLAQIFSIFPSLSLRFLVFHLNCLALVLVLVNSIRSKEQLSTVIESVLMGVTFVGLYAILQRIKGVPVNPAQTDLVVNVGMPGRVYSTMENPNNLGQILIMLIPFYAAVILASESFIKRLIMVGMGIPPLMALALTYSRSSWVGFAVTFFMFVLLINWRYTPLFAFVGLAMIPVLPKSIYNRILTIWDPRDSSVSYRGLIYRTIQPVLENYWLTGVGLGSDTFMKVIQNYPLHTKVIPPHTHNLYIQVWIETGLIGGLAFIGFFISTIKKGVKKLKAEKDRYLKYITIAGISSLTGILVVGVAEYVWYYPRVMVVFWVMAGLLLAALNLTTSPKIKHTVEK